MVDAGVRRFAGSPDTRTLVVLAGIVSATIAAVYWVLRIGFDNPTGPILETLELALFLLAFPVVLRTALIRAIGDREPRWWASHPFLWLVTIGSTGLIGRAVPIIGNSAVILELVGLVFFTLILVTWLYEQGLWRSLSYIAGSIAFGVWTAGVVWGRIYKNPLYFETFIATGKVHHDTLNLAATGNMLRTYHVATTGIDGLNYVPYHWGSAWLFAQWANLIGIDVLKFYQLSFPVIVIPFFFGCIVALAIFLRNRRRDEGSDPTRLSGTFWAVFIAIAVGIAPIAGLDAMGVWTSNIMISESYTIAVPAALLFAAVVVNWADGLSVKTNSLAESKLGWIDMLFLIALIPAGIVLLGYLKISLMALAFAAIVYLGWRLRLYRRIPFLAAILITTVVFYLTYKQVSLPAHREGFVPLDYLSDFVPPPWWPFFLFVHLAWTWIYTIYRLRRENIHDLGELGTAVKERRIIDVELIVTLALIGVVPGLIIHIDGGSAFYFSDVQRWLAGAMLLSWIAFAGTRLWPARSPDAHPGIGGWPTRRLLTALLFIAAVGSIISNAVRWPLIMLRQNVAIREQLYQIAGYPVSTGRIRNFVNLRDPAILATGLRKSPNYAMATALALLQATPSPVRRREALFVPQSDNHYWTSLARPAECSFQSFVGPALAGIAMVDGMPAVGCKLSKYYGIGSFSPRVASQQPAETSDAALCVRAKAIGATRVISMRFPGDSVVRRDISCKSGAT